MPVWTVQMASGADETVEAELLTTDGGALVALSGEGLLLRAWAPGQWRTVQHSADVHRHTPAPRGGDVPVGLPRR
ncbi:hypothetical protein [Geodermatophilus sp. SYSU D00079]